MANTTRSEMSRSVRRWPSGSLVRASVLGLALLGTGCTKQVGVATGVGIAGVGGLLAAGVGGPGGETDPEDFAAPLLITGAVVALVSLAILPSGGGASAAADPGVDPVATEAAHHREVSRARAWQLTKQAAEAARAGDCATTGQLDLEVRQLDADFHGVVFARDRAIATCLTPATPTE